MANPKKPPATTANGIPVEHIDLVRKDVFDVVRKNVPALQEVIEGTRAWSNQQVKLYLALLDKVMPSLSQTHNINENLNLSVEDLSTEQLQRIAASAITPALPPIEHIPPVPLAPLPEEAIITPTAVAPAPPTDPNIYVPPKPKVTA